MKKIFFVPVIGLLILLVLTGISPSISGGGSIDANLGFLDLNDTPNTYVGQANRFVQVNPGETALQFTSASASGDTNCSTSADCNSLYVQKNPIASQAIDPNNSFGLSIGSTTVFTGGVQVTTGGISCFQVDNNPQIRFIVDCTNGTVKATTFLPVSTLITDLGNSSNLWDDFFVQDINSSGDINANGRLCIQGDCRTAWPTGGGSGKTYTSGTPKTIEVNNDLNTISQNFDGNFYSRLNALVPWSDANVANNLTINTTNDANFRNIKFNGKLSGGDFNYSLADANNTQSCSAGSALQSVGATTSCVTLNGVFVEKIGDTMTGGLVISIDTSGAAFTVQDTMSTIYFLVPTDATGIIVGQDIYPTTDNTFLLGGANLRFKLGYFANAIADILTTNRIVPMTGTIMNNSYDLNIVADTNVGGNLNVDGNVFGQVFGVQVAAGTTCTSGCTGFDGTPTGSTWVCLKATTLGAAASTCTDANVPKNCMCQN